MEKDKKNPNTEKETTLYNLIVPSLVTPKLPLTDFFFTFNFSFLILPNAFLSNTLLFFFLIFSKFSSSSYIVFS